MSCNYSKTSVSTSVFFKGDREGNGALHFCITLFFWQSFESVPEVDNKVMEAQNRKSGGCKVPSYHKSQR